MTGLTLHDEPVVITGAGLATSLGVTRHETWRSVLRGECGIGPLTEVESPLHPDKGGGQAAALNGGVDPSLPREVRYLRHAMLDAWAEAGLPDGGGAPPCGRHRCAVMLGTTLHGMRAAGRFFRTDDPEPLRDFLAAGTLAAAARPLGLTGFSATTCSACSSGLGSIALGVTLLRGGEFDLVVAGGYDVISEYAYAGFDSLRLVADGKLRPFARDRQGMKVGEGYAIVVLERAGDAARRGARPLAEILGVGESADAFHLTKPHPEGEGAARAMTRALAAGGVVPERVGLIAAHGTGTPDNDAGEFAALSRVFGPRLADVPVISFKSHLGHTLGAAGAAELILAAMSMRAGRVPACANVVQADTDFDGLRLAAGGCPPAPIEATLNTSLGFGGANTSVVLGRSEGLDPATPSTRACHSPQAPREVVITGVGVVLSNAIGNEAFAALLNRHDATRIAGDTGELRDEQLEGLVNARRVRRMSPYVKYTLAATAVAMADAGLADPAASAAFAAEASGLLGTTHGSAVFSGEFYGQVVREGVAAANPMLFAEGVPNAASAHLSLMLSIKGACQTIIGSRTAGLDALRLASLRIACGDCDRAIVGASEEYAPLVNRAYEHFRLHASGGPGEPFSGRGGFATGCGAVTLILESADTAARRGARTRGAVASCSGASPAGIGGGEIVSAVAEVLAGLGDPGHVLTSANATWIDRAERAGIRRRARAREGEATPCTVSSIYGHIAETFSAGPLAAVAAVLLTGRVPRAFGATAGRAVASDAVRLADGDERPREFGVLCTDYYGAVSGVRVAVSHGV